MKQINESIYLASIQIFTTHYKALATPSGVHLPLHLHLHLLRFRSSHCFPFGADVVYFVNNKTGDTD